ncbi:hypothetical protein Tco_1164310 [Tanacetum coccineum]
MSIPAFRVCMCASVALLEWLKWDDPNITMEEYIRLEEEKARRRGKVYNWETATYATLSYETTVSSLNDNKIDFRISFDESDDEDYTVIYDKNSFSYKIISANDLKTDPENDNKVNMPSFPSPELTVSYFDDLDFFKDFENEFLAIVYNDALTSKSDFLTEPTLSPQHIDGFDLKDETSLSEYDEEEQNVLYFNNLFYFNVIYPDDSKSDEDNDDDKIYIEHSSGEFILSVSPELDFDHYLSHDRAMHPLAPHYERKTRADRGIKRPRESKASSSSTTQNPPSLSLQIDFMVYDNNDESFHSNSLSHS